MRNHCIIEVLYGCGLRVSELIELKISDVNFKENFYKSRGKRKKVRYVPLANYTANLILNYINNVRANNKIGKKYEDHIFLNSRGSSMSRVIVFIIIKELVEKAGIRKKYFSTYFPSFFCYASFAKRCRFKVYPRNAGTF